MADYRSYYSIIGQKPIQNPMRNFSKLFSIALLVLSCLTLSSCEKLFNKSPEIKDQDFTIDENSAVGTVVGQIVADDKSGQDLSFIIVDGDNDEIFSLEKNTGILTVKNPSLLNYESLESINITVEVKDEFGKWNNSEITIAVINLPEINNQIFTIPENRAIGTIIGTVVTVDQNLTFSITAGNTNNAFAIANNGNITVNNETAIDFETTPSFDIEIKATNEGNKNDIAAITINLTDLEPPTNGLMLYMPFDDNINDLSPNSNDGIDYTTGLYSSGKYGKAKEFNGTSDYIELTNSFNNAFGFSCSFWVKTYGVNGVENNGVIIGKYSKYSDNRCFLINSFGQKTEASRADNFVSATFYDPSYVNSMDHDYVESNLSASDLSVYPDPSLWTIVSPQALTLNAWTHCVVNLTSTYLEIYVNGSLCVKKLREHTYYANGSETPTLIGSCLNGGDGANNHFHGALDELRVYNRSFTDDEIKALFLEE